MIKFKCSECGKNLRVKDNAAGKRGKCPQCGAVLHVPAAESRVPFDEPESVPAAPPVQPSPAAPQPVAPQPAHITVNVKGAKATSGFGIAALVLGILACLTCWIPFVGMLSIPISVLGILFGVIGFLISAVGRRSGIGMPVAGTVVCIVAIMIAVASTGGTTAAITEVAREADRKAKATNQEAVLSPGAATKPSHTATAKPAAKEPEQEAWASARNPVRQGDVELRIVRALIGRIRLRAGFDDSETRSKDDLFKIELELRNLSKSKKIEYQSWLGRDFAFGRDYATLKDNFGNGYKRIDFGFGTKIIGQTKSDSIYPGKTIRDVLVFEVPVETAEYLNIELPASNFGGQGMLRLRIPATMIQRR